MRYFILLIISVSLLGACRKKKIKGPASYTGHVRSSYLLKGIPGVQVVMGTYSHAFGSRTYYRIQQSVLTDSNGSFSFKDTIYESVVFIAIADSMTVYNRNEHLGNTYHFKKYDLDSDDRFLLYDPYFASTNSAEVNFDLDALSYVKYSLKKSPVLAQDSITFIGYQYLPLVVKNDTDVYVKLKPRTNNTVEIRRGTFSLHKENFTTGKTADTLYRTFQL